MVNTSNSKKSNVIITEEGLAFDDVLLVPQYSEILPSDVVLTTKLTKNRNNFKQKKFNPQ